MRGRNTRKERPIVRDDEKENCGLLLFAAPIIRCSNTEWLAPSMNIDLRRETRPNRARMALDDLLHDRIAV